MDQLAEKYYSWSPYNFTLNNPINYFDPNGKQVFGIQVGIEACLGLGVSINIALTYDSRGGSFNLLGSFGKGLMVGKGINGNVGVIIGDDLTRTSDLIGESNEYSTDLTVAHIGAGLASIENIDKDGNSSGKRATVISWSYGASAKGGVLKTSTIDLIETFKSIISSSNRKNNDSDQEDSNSSTETTSEAGSNESKSKYTDTMRALLGL